MDELSQNCTKMTLSVLFTISSDADLKASIEVRYKKKGRWYPAKNQGHRITSGQRLYGSIVCDIEDIKDVSEISYVYSSSHRLVGYDILNLNFSVKYE